MTSEATLYTNDNEGGLSVKQGGVEKARVSATIQSDGRSIAYIGVHDGESLVDGLHVEPGKVSVPASVVYAKGVAFSGVAFADLPDPNLNWGEEYIVMDSLVPANANNFGEAMTEGGGTFWVKVRSANLGVDGENNPIAAWIRV